MQKGSLSQSDIENWSIMAGAEANYDTENVLKLVKERANYYKEENQKMEALFKSLHLMDNHGNFPKEIDELIGKLSQIQEKAGVEDLTETSVLLAYLDQEKSRKKYICTLQVCTKLYNRLNKSLERRIENCKNEFENAERQVHEIATLTPTEVLSMQKKIDKYENDLIRLEKDMPWLKNSEFNLTTIAKDIELLNSARKEKAELEKEIKQFHGLEPDLRKAEEQVARIKADCAEFTKQL